MGRIADIIPSLYYNKENDLINFVNALDVEVSALERHVRGIIDLINVDKCPDDKLPYLAALTNCPLIGQDPVFWRKQIKNWPYILKLKGTEKSLALVLDSIEASSWNIRTYFRDTNGNYVTEKPSGQPFKDDKGIWHNIRTHYFGIDFTVSEDFAKRENYAWNDEELKEKLLFWLERGKPYHSELLHMVILPPNPFPDGHICNWDICDWEHIEKRIYNWGMLEPAPPIFTNEPVTKFEFYRGISTIDDIQAWDFSTWGGMPYRFLQFGYKFRRDIFAHLDRENTATWFIPYAWGNFAWNDAERYSRDFFAITKRDLEASFDIEKSVQSIGTIYFIGIIASLQPYWDFYSWTQHDTWGIEYGVPHVLPAFKRDFKAAVQWDENEAPLAKWSKYKTWAGSDTWKNANTLAGTWEAGTWNYEEAI